MNKIYKYSMNTNVADSKGHIRKFLTEHDIKFSSEILIVFEIADNDPRFVDVSKFMSTYRINPRIRLEYSKKELGEAQYLRIWLRRYSGYPLPESMDVEEKNSYINYTFDSANFCYNCGSGLVQKDSFYLKKSFTIDKVRFGGVYWEYDTFFITAELRDLFVREKFTGIEFIPVKNIKTKQIVDTVVQLKINATFPSKMRYEVEKVVDCKICNQKRDIMKTSSEIFVPKGILSRLDKDFYVSQECTGAGLLCCKHVLIRAEGFIPRRLCCNKGYEIRQRHLMRTTYLDACVEVC